jgi:hypothetical protein
VTKPRVVAKLGRDRTWRLVSTGTGVLGAVLAQRALRKVYEAVREDPDAPSPFDPTSAEFSWPTVVVWGVAAGIGLGIAKVVSNRLAVLGWEVATGTLPPGVVGDGPGWVGPPDAGGSVADPRTMVSRTPADESG